MQPKGYQTLTLQPSAAHQARCKQLLEALTRLARLQSTPSPPRPTATKAVPLPGLDDVTLAGSAGPADVAEGSALFARGLQAAALLQPPEKAQSSLQLQDDDALLLGSLLTEQLNLYLGHQFFAQVCCPSIWLLPLIAYPARCLGAGAQPVWPGLLCMLLLPAACCCCVCCSAQPVRPGLPVCRACFWMCYWICMEATHPIAQQRAWLPCVCCTVSAQGRVQAAAAGATCPPCLCCRLHE